MLLTDLAVACRKSGLKVVEQPGWLGRRHGQMKAVRTIACHHTAGPARGEAPSLGYIQSRILSQLVLGRSGTVYVVAAGLCYHAGVVHRVEYSNAYAIGIEAEATGTSPWPPEQYNAYVRLCRALADHYRVPISNVLGHKEIAAPRGRKSDPNFDMGAFRNEVSRGTAPPPPSEDDDLTPDQARMLGECHRELTQRIAGRTDYAYLGIPPPANKPSDTVLGWADSGDARAYEAREQAARALKAVQDLTNALKSKGVI